MFDVQCLLCIPNSVPVLLLFLLPCLLQASCHGCVDERAGGAYRAGGHQAGVSQETTHIINHVLIVSELPMFTMWQLTPLKGGEAFGDELPLSGEWMQC